MPGSYGRSFDDADVLELLSSRVKSAGSQRAFSKQTGIERTYLNQVLKGKKGIGPSIMDALNLRTVYTSVQRQGRADAPLLDHDDLLKLLHSRVRSWGAQEAFAKQTGVDRTTISKMLNAERPVSRRIVAALGLRAVYAPVKRQ